MKTLPAEGRRRLHTNTAYAHLWGFSRPSNQTSPAEGQRCLVGTSVFCTISSRMPSSGLQASRCIKERAECGTGLTQCRTVWRSLGLDVWQKDGITVFGTPIGSMEFVRQKMSRRIAQERRLWDTIPAVPDLQCAWQLLLQSANPRANHTFRTLPPNQSEEFAAAHDEGIWGVVENLLDLHSCAERASAQQVASLPMRMGGLGLRCASRCAAAAYWASWADAFSMISARNPAVVDLV